MAKSYLLAQRSFDFSEVCMFCQEVSIMGKYRSKLQIIADILDITSNGAKKTWIMYQANLSYKLFCRYLEEVMQCGLVAFGEGNSYILTSKGEEFLTKFNEYDKQCKQLEEQVSSVQGERNELEKMLFIEGFDTNPGAQPNKQVLKEKRSVVEGT